MKRIAVTFESTGRMRIVAPRAGDPVPSDILLATHGYGQQPDNLLEYVAELVPPEVALVVPEAPSSFYRRPRPQGSRKSGIGYGWIADPQRAESDRRNTAFLAATLEAALYALDTPQARVWLLGYSQGVGVSTHFAMHHADAISGLVGLAGGVPLADRGALRALAGKPVLWVSGTRDPSYPPAYMSAVVEAFQTAEVDIEHAVLDADHALLPDAREHVRGWLAARIPSAG